MFSQICPRCLSARVQLGFNDAPLHLRLVGIHELLCNNCNLEFRRFVPLRRLKRVESTKRETSANRRRAPRFPAQIPGSVSQIVKDPLSKEVWYSPSLPGHTRDVSSIGLALIMRSVHMGAHDFTDPEKRLWVKLELPSGIVTMRVAPVRYEELGAKGWLIGAYIRSMSDPDREAFNRYIETLNGRKR